jgi:hypothetical protein
MLVYIKLLNQNISMSEMFTNESFFHLSEQEQQREFALILPVRLKHTQELIMSGTATRVLGAVVAESLSDPGPFGTGPLVVPFRRPAWASTKLRSLSEQNDTYAQVVTDRLDVTYDLSIVLISPPKREEGEPAGVLFSDSAMKTLGVPKYRPEMGIFMEDLYLIERQLSEIEDLKVTHNLAIIDPTLLTEGPGETIVNQ